MNKVDLSKCIREWLESRAFLIGEPPNIIRPTMGSKTKIHLYSVKSIGRHRVATYHLQESKMYVRFRCFENDNKWYFATVYNEQNKQLSDNPVVLTYIANIMYNERGFGYCHSIFLDPVNISEEAEKKYDTICAIKEGSSDTYIDYSTKSWIPKVILTLDESVLQNCTRINKKAIN